MTDPVDILRSDALAREAGLAHGFSTRDGGVSHVYRPTLPGGDLNLGFTADDMADNVRENRRRFLRALHAPQLDRFALLRQEHAAVVHAMQHAEDAAGDFTQPGTRRGDGLMTDRPGILLAIGTADCIPVLLFDPVRRAVAAFHAGWRGTVARIVEHGVAAMRRQYGSRPEDLRAAIGPGIGPASYAVSDDVRREFAAAFKYAEELFSKPVPAATGQRTEVPTLYLDLWEANRRQLLDAGLAAERINVLGRDTAVETDRFFSHRAEKGFTGRMLSVIGLTD